MVAAYSISIFLPDGTPLGLRIARRSHWTGEVMMCPRVRYPDVASRPEFSRTGTYILIGRPEEGSAGTRIYVGEADDVGVRLKSHLLAKDFWDTLVLITKSDGSLNKADVRYLEARLVEIGNGSPLTTVDNKQTPAPPLPPEEAHKADLDAFLDDVLPMLEVLGVPSFTGVGSGISPPSLPSATPQRSGLKSVSGQYSFTLGAATGTMSVTENGFVLHAGNGVVSDDKPSLGSGYRALRQRLRDTGRLVSIDGDPDHLELRQDLPLASASAAGAVLYGGNVSGPKQWKDAFGVSLSERESAATSDIQTAEAEPDA